MKKRNIFGICILFLAIFLFLYLVSPPRSPELLCKLELAKIDPTVIKAEYHEYNGSSPFGNVQKFLISKEKEINEKGEVTKIKIIELIWFDKGFFQCHFHMSPNMLSFRINPNAEHYKCGPLDIYFYFEERKDFFYTEKMIIDEFGNPYIYVDLYNKNFISEDKILEYEKKSREAFGECVKL
jgi:hypothetical protein